jgi:hypothetical protein
MSSGEEKERGIRCSKPEIPLPSYNRYLTEHIMSFVAHCIEKLVISKLVTLVFGLLPVRILANALTSLRYFVVFLSHLKEIPGQATIYFCSQLFQVIVYYPFYHPMLRIYRIIHHNKHVAGTAFMFYI